MKKTLIISLSVLVLAGVSFAGSKKSEKSRTPQSVLQIELKGLYVSPAHEPAQIDLEGDNLKTHLMSRFSDANGKPIALKVKATCDSENSCSLELAQ